MPEKGLRGRRGKERKRKRKTSFFRSLSPYPPLVLWSLYVHMHRDSLSPCPDGRKIGFFFALFCFFLGRRKNESRNIIFSPSLAAMCLSWCQMDKHASITSLLRVLPSRIPKKISSEYSLFAIVHTPVITTAHCRGHSRRKRAQNKGHFCPIFHSLAPYPQFPPRAAAKKGQSNPIPPPPPLPPIPAQGPIKRRRPTDEMSSRCP